MSLSNEDKEWLIAQSAQNAVVTRTAIDHVRTELLDRIERVSDRIDHVRTELLDRIEQVETSLLTEFHKWASPMDARMRTHTATLRAIDLEIESVSERFSNLEPKQ